MEFDAVRFSIGPWNSRYSSVWRVWATSGDVYLGVRSLLKYLKVSLHQSGKFRAAFTANYNQQMIEEGKNGAIDRAFLKWDKKPILDRHIMQALDIHFPLLTLSNKRKPDTKKGKKFLLIQPNENSLGGNDTITCKILFHKLPPNDKNLEDAFQKRKVIPFFFAKLMESEYLTIAFQYTRQLPINISKDAERKYGSMIYEMFQQRNSKVGDSIDNLTIQQFCDGSPPAIFNVGRVMVRLEAEDHISISVGEGL